MINQELGEPFRRDAMKKPVAVAGIAKADMRPQVGGVSLPFDLRALIWARRCLDGGCLFWWRASCGAIRASAFRRC